MLMRRHVKVESGRRRFRFTGILGNTVTICRKCYIHPVMIERYMAGDHRLRIPTKVDSTGLQPQEIAVLQHITQRRLQPLRLPVATRLRRDSVMKKILREKSETVMQNGTQP